MRLLISAAFAFVGMAAATLAPSEWCAVAGFGAGAAWAYIDDVIYGLRPAQRQQQ